MRPHTVACAAALPALLAALVGAGAPKPEQGADEIVGSVVLPGGGGLIGARVLLVKAEPQPTWETTVAAEQRSGPKGRFRFTGIKRDADRTAGIYGVVALAPEWGAGFQIIMPRRKEGGRDPDPLLVTLAPPRVVAGIVRNAKAQPMGGVRVSILRLTRYDRAARRYAAGFLPSGLFSAVTDAEGRFAIRGIPAVRDVGVYATASREKYATEQLSIQLTRQHGPLEIVMHRAGGLTGMVRHEDGRPGAGLRMVAQGRTTGRTHTGRTATDENGRFEMTDLKPGVYTVRIMSSDPDRPWRAAPMTGIKVESARTTDRVDLVLVEAALVRGTVTDVETGMPVEGARVSGRAQSGSETATTDADGVYTLRCLPGQISVRVSNVPKGFARPSHQSGRSVLAVRGEAVGGIDFAIQGACRLSGVVLGPDGKPRPRVQVRARLPSRSLATKSTDEEGRFLFDALPPMERIVLQVIDGQAKLSALQTVEFRGELDVDAEIRLAPAPIVRGRVIDAADKPIPRVWVSALRGRGRFGISVASTRTDDGGRYEIAVVPGIPVRVRATRWLKQFKGTVETEVGETYDLPDFVTKVATQITGRVTDEQGMPVEGAWITTFASPSGGRVKTEADGRFVIDNVEPDVRHVVCAAHRDRGIGGSAQLVPAAGVPAAVDIRLSPLGRIEGRVLSPDGRPLAAVNISMTARAGRRFWGASASGVSDRGGRFLVEGIVPDVEYQLRATGSDARLEKPRKVQLPADERRDIGDLRLKEYGTTISGNVTDWTGRPVHNATVSCSVQDVFFKRALTDAQGNYVLRGLPRVDRAFVHANAPGRGRGYVQRARVGQRNVDFILERE